MQVVPGNIVNTRGRDWIVQSGSDDNLLCLRPLTGSSDELAYLIPELESFKESSFPNPNPEYAGNLSDGALFRESVMLRLRDGAGPLRCVGHIAVEPRSYQLTPLLMALRMDTVRLLIADDVGIGKTIEACLIAREYMDRFEIQRMSVLCPPHLVDQWVSELREHFNLDAVALTSSSVYSLEKTVPSGMAITEYYPITVVSLDYIKNQNRRDNYVQTAPEFIIVDEAHTCTEKSGSNSHLRFELVSELAKKADRHMVFLTATPHSGDSNAFGKLLSFLDPRFEVLGNSQVDNKDLRKELGFHFVQRQRKDIEQYSDTPIFARRLRNEYPYSFTPEWKEYFEEVREYCNNLGQSHSDNNGIIWYSILALYRSIASSPASAIKALKNRMENEEFDSDVNDSLFDVSDSESSSDVDLSVFLKEDYKLEKLIAGAKKLEETEDPKFTKLLNVLKKEYLSQGFRPIIFCRYITTAHYVAEKLKEKLKGYTIEVITGEQSAEERQEHVISLGEQKNPILVATDCLSEGINLQTYFNGVIHYDLAWNPTRHEQREGRVDRFGQSSEAVKCAMIYGEDNPVDGLILKVILRKAQFIRDSLGVLVPVPDDGKAIQSALIQATFLKKSHSDKYGQQYFDFGDIDNLEEDLDKPWEDVAEKAKLNRTIFAQRSIHPDEVYKVLNKEKIILGTDKDVEEFVTGILSRAGASPEQTRDGYRIKLSSITNAVGLKELLNEAGIPNEMNATFSFPPKPGYTYIHRTHPLVEQLASYVFEYNMVKKAEYDVVNLGSRCSVTETDSVDELTILYLIRLRMQINTTIKGVSKTSVSEETLLVENINNELRIINGEEYSKYLKVMPSNNLSQNYISNTLNKAISAYEKMDDQIKHLMKSRSDSLKAENDAIRQSYGTGNIGQLSVKPCVPVDLLGVFVLVPSEENL